MPGPGIRQGIGRPLDVEARQTRTPGGGSSSGGAAPPAGPLQLPTVALPWYSQMPPEGTPFWLSGNVTLGPGPVTSAALGVLVIPPGALGVVKNWRVFINTMTPATLVTFGLFINGQPVPGFGNTNIFPRGAASVSSAFEQLIIPVPRGATVQAFITIADAGTYLTGIQYDGWYVPEGIARAYGGVTNG